MSRTRISDFAHGIEWCLCKAATAPNREFETLWLSVAEDYRYLLRHEQREQERGTWEWNALAAPTGE
jgi:hypothetical protein